jgi:hypothetical protein
MKGEYQITYYVHTRITIQNISFNLFLNEIKFLLSRFFFNLRKHGQCFELHCNIMLFILLINDIVYLKCFTNHGGNLYKILTLQSVLYTSVLCDQQNKQHDITM